MNVLITIWVIFIGAIAFYTPQKQSLRDTSNSTIPTRIIQSKATLIIGSLLILLACFSFNPPYYSEIQSSKALLFGYSKAGFFNGHLYFQPLSSIFFHLNLLHLFANLSTLLLLSAYERRVGSLRFLTVFMLSGLFAALLDMLFIPAGMVCMGASGAICGLVAGYIVDHQPSSQRQWLKDSFFALFLILLLSLFSQNTHLGQNVSVNWMDHLFGAIFAAVFVRYF